MAEILLHKDGRGDPADPMDYQPLDVVLVMPDGHPWGSGELGEGTPFFLIRLPGMDVSLVKWLEDEEWDTTTEPGNPQLVKRKKNELKLNQMPQTLRDAVSWNGTSFDFVGYEVTVDKANEQDQFLNAIGLK